MNRRDFIKVSMPAAVIPAIAITCKYEDDEKGPEKGSTHDPTKGEQGKCDWPYRVYCYEREQGEWIFSENTRGSFAPEREYMTFDEEDDLSWNPHYTTGWMDGGVLHFQTFDGATDFVDTHVRTKDDINLIDSIYDIYYRNVYYYDENLPQGAEPTEYHIAHYWFNGDTGRQIHWEIDDVAELKDKDNRSYLVNAQTGERLTTNRDKVESG